jgi:hypothetical protein
MRSTSMLLALSLLSSTATAHAECAWVMWEKRRTRESMSGPANPMK